MGTKKPAEMEQQLKQQLMQKKKKTYANLSQKKESTVFSILPFAKNSITNYKKPTILHHHIKKSHTHFKMIIQSSKNCTKAFYEKKKRKVYAQNQQQKKH